MTLEGYYEEILCKQIIISLRLCNTETYEGICVPILKIYDFFPSTPIGWNVYMQNSIINTLNYYNPISSNTLNVYLNVRMSVSRIYNLTLNSDVADTIRGTYAHPQL